MAENSFSGGKEPLPRVIAPANDVVSTRPEIIFNNSNNDQTSGHISSDSTVLASASLTLDEVKRFPNWTEKHRFFHNTSLYIPHTSHYQPTVWESIALNLVSLNQNPVYLIPHYQHTLNGSHPSVHYAYQESVTVPGTYSQYIIDVDEWKLRGRVVLVFPNDFVEGQYSAAPILQYQNYTECTDGVIYNLRQNPNYTKVFMGVSPDTWVTIGSLVGARTFYRKTAGSPFTNRNLPVPCRLLPTDENGKFLQNLLYNDGSWEKTTREHMMLPDGRRVIVGKSNQLVGVTSKMTSESVRVKLTHILEQEFFLKFEKFPLEVRNMILSHLEPAPRLLKYRAQATTDASGNPQVKFWMENVNASVPMDTTLRSINKESLAYFNLQYQTMCCSIPFSSPPTRLYAGQISPCRPYPWFNKSRDLLILSAEAISLLQETTSGFQSLEAHHVILQSKMGEPSTNWNFCRRIKELKTVSLTMNSLCFDEMPVLDTSQSNYQFRVQPFEEANFDLLKYAHFPVKAKKFKARYALEKTEADNNLALFRQEMSLRPGGVEVKLKEGEMASRPDKTKVTVNMAEIIWYLDNAYSALWSKLCYVLPKNQKTSHVGISYFIEDKFMGVKKYTRKMCDENLEKIRAFPVWKQNLHTYEHNGIRQIIAWVRDKGWFCDEDGQFFLQPGQGDIEKWVVRNQKGHRRWNRG